nr:H-NS family nucleoid-associated regulatory protein [Variovorax soli]
MASFNEGAGAGRQKSEKRPMRSRRGTVSAEHHGSVDGLGRGPGIDDLVRYRDPESGRTWSGYGRPPNWIRGKDRERFLVQPSARQLS